MPALAFMSNIQRKEIVRRPTPRCWRLRGTVAKACAGKPCLNASIRSFTPLRQSRIPSLGGLASGGSAFVANVSAGSDGAAMGALNEPANHGQLVGRRLKDGPETPVDAGKRHPHGSGTAGAQRREDDDDLHTRPTTVAAAA